MSIKCKCGGELYEEEQPVTFQEKKGFVIGRCGSCKKPYSFAKEMWQEINAVESGGNKC